MTETRIGESRRVREVADKYRASGYEVFLAPKRNLLPDFLADYQPDFLARLGDENVLVDVKEYSSPEAFERYKDLADRIATHPGWRLDLVVRNPANGAQVFGDIPVLPTRDVPKRLEEAKKLVRAGHSDAAFLIAWAAIEATLRLLAEKNAIPVHRSATPTLLKQLVTHGVVGREQYDSLWEAFRQRSAVAHGFVNQSSDVTTRALITLGQQLLTELQRVP